MESSPRSSTEPTLQQRFPERAGWWRLRSRCLHFEQRPLIMGIVNVTPDSFSDGGRFFDPAAAVKHGLELVRQGADILDVGGESTRPYSTPVDLEEELRRVRPVIRALCREVDVPLSIDTTKSAVARQAIEAGAEIINDVSGLQADRQMVSTALAGQVGVCVMHMRGTPATMQDDPVYDDVVEDIRRYLLQRRDALTQQGLARERICLDPGIGFGKTHQHNLTLLAQCGRFHALECPLLVGYSRKAFLGKILQDKQADRTAAGIGAALAVARQGVQVIRVHDVQLVRQALLAFEAGGGFDGRAWQGD